jgi:branched-chain amino acid transport system ATP-binding protein
MTLPVLELQGIVVRRGMSTVFGPLSQAVPAGRICALLGPNGAGKSSLLRAVAGVLPLAEGRLLLDGRRFDGLPPDAVRRLGVAAVPQGHQVLPRLHVHDNLRAAGSMLPRAALERALARCYQVFPELAERRRQLAGGLSGGEQKMLALAQALMSQPRFMLVDELSLALAPMVVDRLLGVVKALAGEGIGVLLVEQFPPLALRIADHACVLSRGGLRYDGPADALAAAPALLRAAYLGACDGDGGD